MEVNLSLHYDRHTAIDARKMIEKSKQLLRIRAWTLYKVDGYSGEEIAACLGVSHGVVYKWIARAERYGPENLTQQSKVKGKGRSKLSLDQREELKQIMLTSTPNDYGYGVVLWTCALIASLIEQKYRVTYRPSSVGDLLRRMKLSPQKPIRTSYRQDSSAVEKWRTETYPALAQRAETENATIVWCDERTMCSSPDIGRTWGLQGQTPVIRVLDSTEKVNVIGTVDNSGRTEFMVFEGKMNSQTFCCFIDELMGRCEGKIFLILDIAPSHTSSETILHLSKNRDRLEFFFAKMCS